MPHGGFTYPLYMYSTIYNLSASIIGQVLMAFQKARRTEVYQITDGKEFQKIGAAKGPVPRSLLDGKISERKRAVGTLCLI